jgi:hypothetical protein
LARSLALLAAFLLLAAGFLLAGTLRLEHASRDVTVYESVCTQLLGNTTEGRQALVSSLWWPPLPFLVRLPLAAAFNLPECPLASLAASALFAAATLLLTYRVLRRWLPRWAGAVLVAAMALSPPLLRAATDGSATTLLMYLMLLATYGMVDWLRTREVRFLVYAASGSALLIITAAEALPWVLLFLAILVADTVLRPAQPGQKEAVLFLGLLPPVYTTGFWLLMNWLIMGDPWYPLRPLAAITAVARAGTAGPVSGLGELPVVLALAAGLPLLLLSGRRRERTGLALAGIVVLPVIVMAFLDRTALSWMAGKLPAATLPLTVVTIGYLSAMTELAQPRLRRWLLAAPALAVVVTWSSAFWFETPPDRRPTFAASLAERQRWLPLIEQRVRQQTQYPKIFVCGYASFQLLGPAPDPLFVPALDFNFHEAESDYYGHQLYVLVHRPEGRSAMESITWKYDRMFSLGGKGTLYDSDWGPWRLFAIVQAPP